MSRRLAELWRPSLAGSQLTYYRLLIGLIPLGILLRALLLAISYGSNDMEIWTGFADFVREHGLWETYREKPGFNHPPLMGLLAAALKSFADWTTIPFRILFKLPPLAADLLAMRLLWLCWRPKGLLAAAAAVALYSCNPVSILVTGFHGSTDTLCAVIMLLAAFYHSRAKWLLAGLAIGGAFNVKIVALILIPGLFMLCPRPRDARRFLLGFGIACLPFLGVLLSVPQEFYGNAIAYNSNLDRWGFIGWGLYALPADPALVYEVILDYRRVGRLIVIAFIGLFALIGRRCRWDAYRSAAVAMSTFLFAAPGFAPQYLVWVVPLFAASTVKYSLRWASAAGLFAALIYHGFLIDSWPLQSVHNRVLSGQVGLFGMVAWGVLLLYLVGNLRGVYSPQSPTTG